MLALRNLRLLLSVVAPLILGISLVRAEQYENYQQYADDFNNNNGGQYGGGYGNNDDGQYYGDDGAAEEANEDDAEQAYYYDNIYSNGDFSAGDDTITYWTDYAILPKRCIV